MVTHGITLAKQMVKRGGMIFFPSDKNLNQSALLTKSVRIQG